ncbi:hypothetical protein [Cytobacillus firmus]|nr:hypothetical protein [Cytobacillus firmus]
MTENKMPEMMVMASGVKSASPLTVTGINATIDYYTLSIKPCP